MRIRKLISSTAALLVVGIIVTTAIPATAAPFPTNVALLKSAAPSDVIDVRVRRRSGGAGIAAGLAAGLIFGGLIASSPYHYGGPSYYYGPPGYYPPGYYGPVYGPRYIGPRDWVAYCFSRYRSFDPVSGTYMGYDGRRHYCR